MPAGLRSLLFAPAGDLELVAKLPRSEPDAVVLDLEDGTAVEHKEAARAGLEEAVALLPEKVVVCVRVNPPGTPWHDDDVAAVPARVAYVVVPKVEAAVDLGRDVIAGIETVRGVLDVCEVVGGGSVAFAYFGAEDYVADLGGVRTRGSEEVLYARSRVALACRAAGVPALDQVVVDFGDDEAFRADARRGRSLGYRGKLCIHPRQVALAHEAFTPSQEEVAHARRVLEGDGVVVVDGAMVDEPMRRAARAVLDASGHR